MIYRIKTGEFLLKISDVIFQGQTFYWTYLRNGWSDWCETQGGTSVGYSVTYVTWPLTLPMTLTLDFSRSNFKIAVSHELLSDWCETGGLIDMERNGCELITHDHDHDIWVTMVGLGTGLRWLMDMCICLHVLILHACICMYACVLMGDVYTQTNTADWHGTKWMWVDHSWPWPWHLGNHGGVGYWSTLIDGHVHMLTCVDFTCVYMYVCMRTHGRCVHTN